MKKFKLTETDAEVEAIQVTLENFAQIMKDLGSVQVSVQQVLFDISIVRPEEGRVTAGFQDWIVRDADGLYHAVDRTEFKRTFKEVTEETA